MRKIRHVLRQRLRRIAVLTEMSGYSARVLRGIMSYARPAKPWLLHLLPPSLDAIESLKAWQPDGIMALLTTQAQVEAICRFNVPVVNSGFYFKNRRIAHLGQDDGAIGVIGARYFLERGFRHFAFIGDERVRFSQLREEGFAAALAAAGHGCVRYRDRLHRVRSWGQRYEFVQQWLRNLPKPSAVLACNDEWGWHVAEACQTARIAVPDQIALLGVDNDPLLCDMTFPSLSSIDTRPERIGFRVAEVLDRLLHGARPATAPILFGPERVITRQSSDSIALSDADVAEAVRFIREHVAVGVNVAEVVAHVAVSRRMLERKFRELLGRSPLEEIHLRRIEHAKALLIDTDLPLRAVATQSGFADRQRFASIFKAFTRHTAQDYRQQQRLRIKVAPAVRRTHDVE